MITSQLDDGLIAYQTPNVTLYQGDCIDVISSLPGRSLDLIVTDPPYGVDFQSNRRTLTPRFAKLAGDDGSLDVPGVLGGAVKLLRNHRHVYVFGYSPEQLTIPMDLSATVDIIWDKQMLGMGDLTIPWAQSHERITFGVVSFSSANRASGDGRLAARMRTRTVISVPRKNSRGVNRHPTEKPVQLLRQLIESSSIVGDLVFDPFAGTGSTLVAAVLAGRRCIGVEIDAGYVGIAIARLTRAEAVAAEMAVI